jgi:carboxymethylenebutenolidase
MMLFLAALVISSPTGSACCRPDLMAKFADDPAFVSAHPTPVKLHFKATTGHSVSFKAERGPEAGGFYVPPSGKSHSAVILVHEFWGLNDNIRNEAQKLHAHTGYAVFAIDLYDGKATDDRATAAKYMQEADPNRCLAIEAGAIHALKSGALGFKPRTIGTVGYCFGGGWSERAAVVGGKNVQACIVYYGMPDMTPESLAKLKAPILMFYGTKDQWINAKVVGDFTAAMKAARKSLEVHAYDANHGFANPSNPIYDKAAAADTIKREIAFFKAHL